MVVIFFQLALGKHAVANLKESVQPANPVFGVQCREALRDMEYIQFELLHQLGDRALIL